MKRKTYPAYKDSGVEWIGEVPSEWEIDPLKTIARINPSKSKVNLPKDSAVSFLPMECIGEDGSYNSESTRALNEVESGYTQFIDGDILIAKITPCFENGKGTIVDNLVAGVGFGTTELHVIRLNQGVPKYIWYILSSHQVRENGEALMYGAGGQKRVPSSFYETLTVPLPPLSEQQAIADFLDRKTAAIDRLISLRQRQVELLREKRQGMIQRAVTKGPGAWHGAGVDTGAWHGAGVDTGDGAAVEMKDSGVEWIGQVPKGWRVYQLKHLLCGSLQYGAQASAEFDNPEWPRYVRITDIDEYGRLRPDSFKSLPPAVARPFILQSGDLLFARSGSVGKTFLYDEAYGQAAYAGYLIRAKINHSVSSPKFLRYFCQSASYWSWVKTVSIQATIENISAERYSTLPIPLPPVSEQQAIADFLDRETARMDSIITKAEAQVAMLREYRTALISEAVTGKIDVRSEL